MSINLLDLVNISPRVYTAWSEIAKKAAIEAIRTGLSPEALKDEDARVDPDGSLVIFAHVAHLHPELRVSKEEWKLTPFAELDPETQLSVVGLIAKRTPRDRSSRGVDWQGKLFGYIESKGYISPDGKVFRFMYNQEGPFHSLSESAVFGYSLGDAAPSWTRGR